MNGKAQICDQCGAPMKNRRECEYCGTVYYLGPEIPQTRWEGPSYRQISGSSAISVWATYSVASDRTYYGGGNVYASPSY